MTNEIEIIKAVTILDNNGNITLSYIPYYHPEGITSLKIKIRTVITEYKTHFLN